MSDRIHDLERQAIHAEYDKIKAQIRESRGLLCEHATGPHHHYTAKRLLELLTYDPETRRRLCRAGVPPAVPCGCALSVKCAAEIGKQMKAPA